MEYRPKVEDPMISILQNILRLFKQQADYEVKKLGLESEYDLLGKNLNPNLKS